MTRMLQDYLRDLREIHFSGAGVAETSFYGPLRDLLNRAGDDLQPRVRCIIQLRNRGAGLPDGGLFTPEQLPAASGGAPLPGQIPSRGVVEVKGAGEDVREVARRNQVRGYLADYGQVLVTTLRDFALVTAGPDGAPELGESFSLAGDEAAFWAATGDPAALDAEIGERFEQYLRRALLHRAPLASPKDLAFFLASYARDAKARIERRDLPGLTTVRSALEESLGLRFEGGRGEQFFRSTFVQTLFYGIFSAWVLWSRLHPAGDGVRFQWRTAVWSLRVPAIRAIFEQVAVPSALEPLGLEEVLDWAEAALDRVDRAAFFSRFEQADAVQYFYEPFLEAFDPELRRALGVWYTPTEVVEYMVARVDAVLREELGIADGFADPRVYVLDPCTGTGSYLVAVLKRIERTLRAKGEDALVATDLKRAALERVFGFEILPAPFVVAHLQLGVLLQNAGAALSTSGDERVGVYLTNALTGWEPPHGPQLHLALRELEEERDAAERVKRESRILVVLGNPPYNGFAGVAVEEERALSDAYRVARATRQPQGQGLNDLYVRFFRMAERRVAEMSGEGVVCFVSNYSWLDGLSFTAMRERYLEAFDGIWIDCLNGDKYRTGKRAPDGAPDPSVFSTRRNREGIQVGTAVALMVRKARHRPAGQVRFRNLWGAGKLAQLQAEAEGARAPAYDLLTPPAALGLPLLPMGAPNGYLDWPSLPELLPASHPGVKTSRDDVVVDIDRGRLIARMERYFDPNVGHDELRCLIPGAMDDSDRFRSREVRDALRKRGFLEANVVRYCYRPLDARWLYWEPETKLLDEKRPAFFAQVGAGNLWIEARQKQTGMAFDRGLVTGLLADNQGNGLSNFFPLHLRTAGPPGGRLALGGGDGPRPNLSAGAAAYLRTVEADASELFFHLVAVLHAPAYRRDNAGALRQDWPRIPLSADRGTLLTSAALGRELAALLDPDRPVPGVTAGAIRSELRPIAVVSRLGGGALDPGAGDLAVTARWGYRGAAGAVMAGPGKVTARPYGEDERRALAAWGDPLGLTAGELFAPLDGTTADIFLNDRTCLRNVPVRVWGYTLGGYQVMKKWLSYRELGVLGRAMTEAEVRDLRDVARRIAAILLLEPRLDAGYRAVVGATYEWRAEATGTERSLRLW